MIGSLENTFVFCMLRLLLLLLALSVSDGYNLLASRVGMKRAHASRAHAIVASSENPPEPASMKMKALKAELDERGVTWRGVAFEKDELVRLLEVARTQPLESETPAPEETPSPEPSAVKDEAEEGVSSGADSAGEAAAYDAAYATALEESLKLKVKELRTELAARNVGWADLYEKEELAARLAGLKAQSALFSRSGALTPGQASVVNDEQLRVEMADDRTPLLIDVFATWCGPCKLITPMLGTLADKFGDRVRVAKLDSDQYAQLSTELRVSGLPTLIFMREGKEVHRLEGVPGNTAALEQLASQHLGIQL